MESEDNDDLSGYIWFASLGPDGFRGAPSSSRPRVSAPPGSSKRLELVRRLAALPSSIISAGEDHGRLREELQHALDVAADLRRERDRVASEGAEISERLRREIEDADESRALLQRVRTDRDLLRSQCERYARDRDDMRAMRDRAQSDADAARAARDAAARQIAALHRDVEGLISQRDAALAEAEDQRRSAERMAGQLGQGRDRDGTGASGDRELDAAVEARDAALRECAVLREELSRRKATTLKVSSSSSSASGRGSASGCVYYTSGLYKVRYGAGHTVL